MAGAFTFFSVCSSPADWVYLFEGCGVAKPGHPQTNHGAHAAATLCRLQVSRITYGIFRTLKK